MRGDLVGFSSAFTGLILGASFLTTGAFFTGFTGLGTGFFSSIIFLTVVGGFLILLLSLEGATLVLVLEDFKAAMSICEPNNIISITPITKLQRPTKNNKKFGGVENPKDMA